MSAVYSIMLEKVIVHYFQISLNIFSLKYLESTSTGHIIWPVSLVQVVQSRDLALQIRMSMAHVK